MKSGIFKLYVLGFCCVVVGMVIGLLAFALFHQNIFNGEAVGGIIGAGLAAILIYRRRRQHLS